MIVYYCLSGDVPFFRNTDDERFDAIKVCKWEFSDAIWDDISDEAKDLIRNLLVKDPSKRLTAVEILQHPWFDKAA